VHRISRRTLIAGLSALGAGVFVAIGSWIAGFAIRDEAARSIERRFGLAAEIEGVWVGAGETTFYGVSLADEARGIQVGVDRLDVRVPLFRFLTEGATAVREISVEGAAAVLDLTAPAFESGEDSAGSEFRPRSARARSSSPGERLGGIDVSLADTKILVRDEWGALLRIEGLQADRRADGWHVASQTLAMGSSEGERLRASSLTAVASGRSLALQSGGVGRIEVAVLSERSDDSASAPGSPRLARRLRALPLAWTRLSGGSATQIGLGGFAEPAAPAGSDDHDASNADEGRPGADRRGWLRFIAPGGAIHVARGVLTSVLPDGERPIMEDFAASLARDDEGRLRTHGGGETDNGGRISWTLDFGSDGRHPEGRILLDEVPLALLVPVLPPELPLFRPERARVGAELQLARRSEGQVDVEGRLALRDLALDSPSVARDPLQGVSFSLEGKGALDPQVPTLTIHEGSVRARDVEVRLSGRVGFPAGGLVLEADAVLPATPCGAAVQAIPRDALGELVGFSFDGNLAGSLRLIVDTRDPDRTEFEARVADGCRFEAVPALADLERFRGPFVHRVREPDGSWFEMTTGPGTGNWTSIHRISPYFIHAVLAHEDGGFFGHAGFANWAIEGALTKNLRAGRVVWGGSTITMQLAKNLFLARERTLVRKVQEVLLTWWLESRLAKLDILELYLNVIEYGPGVYGVRAAAWHYFRRRPSELSPAESAYLASVLPAPKRYQTSYQRGELTAFMKTRLGRRLEHMHDRGRIDQVALEYGLAELQEFSFADPSTDEPAPPRIVPPGAAPLPRLGEARPEDFGWEADAPIGDLGGSPRDLDLGLAPEDLEQP